MLNAQELKKVSLQLQWLDQFQFAGYYMAKEKGYYKDVGLDVEIKKYNHTIDPVEEVIKGNATYGIGRSTLIMNKMNGANIKLLFSIFQSSPMVMVALKNSNIQKISDIVDKRIMITKDATFTISLQAMAMKEGIRLKKLNLQIHTFNIDDLIDNKTDLISGYISNEPFRLKERGYESTIFDPKEYGFDFYSDILFTTSKEIATNKKTVQKMKDASLKGWKYAFNHIQETAKLIKQKYNIQNKSLNALIYEGEELKKLAYYKTTTLGLIDKHKIQRIFDIYNVMGYVKGKLDIKNFIFHSDEKQIHLTKEELSFLKEKEVIKMCSLPNEMPLSKIIHNKLTGISADYIQLISQKINTKFQLIPTKTWKESLTFIKNNKCDILPIAQSTPKRQEYLDFTKSYLSTPLVIATTMDKHFVAQLKLLLDKKFTIKKGYSSIELLKNKYPNIKLIEVDNTADGLQKVLDGEAYGYISALATTAYEIQKNYYGTLKISGYAGEKILLKTAVRKDTPLLLSIFNKCIRTISQDDKDKLINNYLNINIIKKTDYILIWKLVAAFVLIILIIFIFVIKQNKHQKELKRSKEQIHQYMNLMLDGFAIMKMETKEIIFCNKAFENITGHSLEELQKMQSSQIYPKNALPYIITQLEEQQKELNSIISNIPILSKNGDITVYDVDLSIVTINGSNLYFANFRNLSEKIQAESNLRQENQRLRELLNKYQEELN